MKVYADHNIQKHITYIYVPVPSMWILYNFYKTYIGTCADNRKTSF